MLGLGNGQRKESNSVFDNNDDNIAPMKNGHKRSHIDPSEVLVENEMLRSELQKMQEKMNKMEKVS